jgi:uncharacterized protein (DUF305 family)
MQTTATAAQTTSLLFSTPEATRCATPAAARDEILRVAAAQEGLSHPDAGIMTAYDLRFAAAMIEHDVQTMRLLAYAGH